MKIALGQMNVVQGRPQHNFEVMKQMIEKARSVKADLIVFPEMAISGLVLEDQWLNEDWCLQVDSYNEQIKACSQDIGIIYGNLAFQPSNKTNNDQAIRYNAVHFCYNCEWVKKEESDLFDFHIQYQNQDVRVFDDSRYFVSGMEVAAKQNKSYKDSTRPFLWEKEGKVYLIGTEVGNDLWYCNDKIDSISSYIEQDVDFLVHISSSPWTLNQEKLRDSQVMRQAMIHNQHFVPLVSVHNCGMQNTGKNVLVFDGDSTIYGQDGLRLASLNDEFKQECQIFDLQEKQPITRNPNKKLMNALCCAIKEFDTQLFFPSMKWIVGLSGGLDSSITAALLVLALGKERVIGYNMATQYNSDTTKNNARYLAKQLGIVIHEGSIEKVIEATTETLCQYGYTDQQPSLVIENIQARIRGHMLSTFASIENGVVVNNGNKIEVALGYCTLYGDAIGALSPIGDCTKVQLFELAACLNETYGKEIIPENLLPQLFHDNIIWELPPSAELKEKQRDPMKWFYHDWLISRLTEYPKTSIEDIMQKYLDGTLLKSDLNYWLRLYGLDDPQLFVEDLEWIIKTMSLAAFKRIQTPPIVLISEGAFGSDIREAQQRCESSLRYQQLKAKILALKK